MTHSITPENLPVNYQVLTALPMGVQNLAATDGNEDNQGGNKTFELMFDKNCPKQYKCKYQPNGKEPNIDQVMDSLNQISKLQDDIESNHQNLSDQEAINLILDIEVAASFFPSIGVYNELISTGSYELVNNSELKRTLIDLYETQKERNYTMSISLDNLMLQYIRETLEGFSIRFSYNKMEGEVYGDRVIQNYKFDQKYYLSKKFYGLLSTLSFPANNYNKLLITAKKSIEDAKKLIIIEVADT